MEYQYKCRITAWDFFRLTMRQTYHSMAGMCNLVFTVAMILLTAKFWVSREVLQVLMLIGCLLFPVSQPAAIYAKARRQAAAVPQDVQLTFDEKGLLVYNRRRGTASAVEPAAGYKTAGDGAGAFRGSRKRLYADQPCAGEEPTGSVLVLCTEQSGTE